MQKRIQQLIKSLKHSGPCPCSWIFKAVDGS